MKLNKSIFLILFLTSCASIDTNRIAPAYVEAFNSIKQSILGVENKLDPALISNIPYASMTVRIGKGPTALMILENVNQEGNYWISADGVYLVIKNGRIIKTSGLPNNLKERLSSYNGWNEDIYDNQKFISYYSFSDPVLNNLRVESNYLLKQTEIIDLMFGPKELTLVEENIFSKEIAWSETNLYWIDNEGFVWKSVQNISPKLPGFYIEVTKKPQ